LPLTTPSNGGLKAERRTRFIGMRNPGDDMALPLTRIPPVGPLAGATSFTVLNPAM
jgi:hypothetical protein